MYPILFEIPGLGWPIRSFGVMVVLGFLLGTHLLTRWYQSSTEDPERHSDGLAALPVWVMIGVIFGARFAYVIVELVGNTPTGQAYKADPLSVLFIWQGGLVMYGGCFGSILMGWLCLKKHKMPFKHTLDLALVAGFFGLAIGRIGCLLVGDDFGSIVDPKYADWSFPLVLHVPETLRDGSLFGEANRGQVLWATQPWMTTNAALLGFLGMRFLKTRKYAGQVGLKLLLLYSIGRYAIEMFRGDSIRGLWDLGFTTQSTSQLVSVGLFVTCAFLLWRNRGKREDGAAITGHANTEPDAA
tara:strand:- start:1466 stop:2362 length:897 start_codon:yes stop_codon:yes gene_type:complete